MNSAELISRKEEQKILMDFLSLDEASFMALYGRRRVGKTFLIRGFFDKRDLIFFNVTGSRKGTLKEQINHFTREIGNVFYQGAALKAGKNWDETFDKLTLAIKSVPGKKKIVLFFDEFPWMATKNSRLLTNLEYYWNQHWSRDNRVKLIICGSSASWIINKIVNNTGGLHNRVTHNMHLEPFDLKATKDFLHKRGIKLNNRQVLNIYMVLGGIPFYLTKVKKGLTATQIIESLAFRKNSFLMEEFDNLFAALFSDYESCMSIIRVIAGHRYGIGQEALLKVVDKSLRGAKGKRILKSLINAGFIIRFIPHFHKEKGIYYRVIDEYTLFYFKWIEPVKNTLLHKSLGKGYWEHIQTTPAWNSWAGYTFESICYNHLSQISNAINLSPTAIPNTWRFVPRKGSEEKGAQIDLLYDRDDDAITIFEIKLSNKPFAIDKNYAEKLKQKLAVFKQKTRTKKQLFLAMVVSDGLKKTIYSEDMLDGIVTLDDLFKAAD